MFYAVRPFLNCFDSVSQKAFHIHFHYPRHCHESSVHCLMTLTVFPNFLWCLLLERTKLATLWQTTVWHKFAQFSKFLKSQSPNQFIDAGTLEVVKKEVIHFTHDGQSCTLLELWLDTCFPSHTAIFQTGLQSSHENALVEECVSWDELSQKITKNYCRAC